VCLLLPFLVELNGKATSDIRRPVEVQSELTTPLKENTRKLVYGTSVKKSKDTPMKLANDLHVNSLKDIIKDQEELIRANITDEAIKELLFGWQRKVFEMLLEKQKNDLLMIEWKKQQALNQEQILTQAEHKYSPIISDLKQNIESAKDTITNLEAKVNQWKEKAEYNKEKLIEIKSEMNNKFQYCIKEHNKNIYNVIDAVTNRIEQASNKLMEAKEIINEDKASNVKQLVNLHKVLEEKEHLFVDEAKSIEKLKDEKEEIEKMYLQLKDQYTTLEEELKNVSKKQNKEVMKLKEELNTKTSESDNAVQLLRVEEETRKDVEKELSEWKQKYEELKVEVTKEQSEAIELYEQLTSQNTLQAQRIKALEAEIEALKETYNKDIAEIEQENKIQARNRESKLRSLKIERDSLLQKVNELKRMKIANAVLTADKEVMVSIGREEVKVKSVRAQPIKVKEEKSELKFSLPQRDEDESEDLLPSERLLKKLEGIELAAEYAIEDI